MLIVLYTEKFNAEPSIMKLLSIMPRFIRQKIESRSVILKVLDNIGWLFFDSILRKLGGLVVGVWLVRYLGPEQFGQLSYAIAFIALFGGFSTLGINGIVVRDVVRDPVGLNATLGSALVLMLLSSFLAFFLAVSSIALLKPDDALIKSIVVILGASLIFRSSDIIKYWFESRVMSRYVAWLQSLIFLVISLVKVVMIVNSAPLIAFAWVFLADAVLAASGLIAIYVRKAGKILDWSVSLDRSIALLKEALPLMLMSVLLGVYTKTDILMVEYFLGWEATGFYSASLTIAESWFFIAVIFVQSLFPSLIKSELLDENAFRKKLLYFYSFMFWFSSLVSFLLFILSKWMVVTFYGANYVECVLIFQIYIWSGIFVFVITSSSRWFILKHRNSSLFARAFLGAIMNVILNIWLIKLYGVVGASLSTLITYFVVAYIYDIFDKSVREQLIYKIDAVVLPLKILWKKRI